MIPKLSFQHVDCREYVAAKVKGKISGLEVF